MTQEIKCQVVRNGWTSMQVGYVVMRSCVTSRKAVTNQTRPPGPFREKGKEPSSLIKSTSPDHLKIQGKIGAYVFVNRPEHCIPWSLRQLETVTIQQRLLTRPFSILFEHRSADISVCFRVVGGATVRVIER
jgi:hypothetical protein